MAAPKQVVRQKKHICTCGKESRPIMVYPGKRIMFRCDSEHVIQKKETTLV